MWLGDQLFVVVSDPKIVKDLVITNGAIFSSRKEMYMKSQLIFVRRGITATPYDETWYAIINIHCITEGLHLLQAQAPPPGSWLPDYQGRRWLCSRA